MKFVCCCYFFSEVVSPENGWWFGEDKCNKFSQSQVEFILSVLTRALGISIWILENFSSILVQYFQSRGFWTSYIVSATAQRCATLRQICRNCEHDFTNKYVPQLLNQQQLFEFQGTVTAVIVTCFVATHRGVRNTHQCNIMNSLIFPHSTIFSPKTRLFDPVPGYQ